MPNKRQNLGIFLDSIAAPGFFFYSTLIFIFILNKRVNENDLWILFFIFVSGLTLLVIYMCFIHYVD